MNGFSLAVIPLSWRFGRFDRGTKKTLWAIGPFRFVLHRRLGAL